MSLFTYKVSKPSQKRTVVRHARRDGKGGSNEGLSSPFHSACMSTYESEVSQSKYHVPNKVSGAVLWLIFRHWGRV